MSDLDKIRDDYKTVIKWFREVESWSQEDLDEYQAMASRVMGGNDALRKKCLADDLAGKAERFRREMASKKERASWPVTA